MSCAWRQIRSRQDGFNGRTAALGAAVIGTAVLLVGGIAAYGGHHGQQPDPNPLPTGGHIVPQGMQTEVGSFPVNLALSPDGRFIAVTNTGARQYISLLSAEDGHLISQLSFNESSSRTAEKPSLYVGLAFGAASDGRAMLYASRGPEDKVSMLQVSADGILSDTGKSLDIPSGLPPEAKNAQPNFIAGIALNSTGKLLYAADNETSDYTQQSGSVSVIDIAANRVLCRAKTAGFPYAIAAITQGANTDKKVYVTSERDGVVIVLDVSIPADSRTLRQIKTGDHPMALLLNKDQSRLYVANASSDTVSVIDTTSDKVLRKIELRGRSKLPGITPTGLALSPDGTHLYVTLGDTNAVAVVDVEHGKNAPEGLIPTGWYPTAAVVSSDGKRLFVANAKGVRTRNPNGTKAGLAGAWGTYIEDIIEGTVAMLPVPAAEDLPGLTGLVDQANHAISAQALPKTGIKHVFYIIKENRTYDQVLGDLPKGNGDPKLTLFGRDVTPNLHALAERFVLLDNFYCSAEVSADGWNWSTSGMANEYTIRNVPFNYSGRGRDYDFEGATNGTPVDLLGMPDVAKSPGGYLWEAVAKKRLTYRNYGFWNAFGDLKSSDGKLLAKENAPLSKALAGGHTDENYLRFEMSYADSDAWKTYNAPSPTQRLTYGQFKSPSRISEWRREFDACVKNGDLPAFTMLRLPRDHTSGTRAGSPSPRAMVADNDYAVGQLVEAVSHSRYWKESAIFVLEDDAQDGTDHVDAHRAPAFAISPCIPKNTLDHRFYNTDSFLHTMEMLLGVPPMCQYDASAPVLQTLGAKPDNAEPYTAILPARSIIADLNSRAAYRASDSANLDFTRADRVPPGVMSDILWHSVKGARTPIPVTKHGLPASTLRRTEKERRESDD